MVFLGASGGRPRAVIVDSRGGVLRPATVACSIFRSRMFASFLFTDLVIAGGVILRLLGC